MSDTQTFATLTAVMRALGPAQKTKAQRWHKVTVSTLTATEELLDWLENAGYTELRLVASGDGFVVRWR